ncbi:MAG: carboxylating nicotinate-nucleotide diphosphorylase [Corynebacterium variabile]
MSGSTTDFPVTAPLGDLASDPSLFTSLAQVALAEDLASGDATTLATVSADQDGNGELIARQDGVISGVDAVAAILEVASSTPAYADVLGGTVTLTDAVTNGTRVAPGDVVGVLSGSVRAMLQLERTVLNMLSHASGVATHTAEWVDEVGPDVAVRDSRKTLPGLRLLQKRAVVHGGGVPHRYNLSDQAMVKDNHVLAGGGVVDAYLAVRHTHPDLWCEVEVDTLEQLREVLTLDEPPQQVLLDNFSVEQTESAVSVRAQLAPEVLLESSGGLTLEVAGDYAAAGVESLAVGALTHSVTVMDIGLDLV